LSYKADVDDLRESPALEVAELLAKAGAEVVTYEPFAPLTEVPGSAAAASLGEALLDAEAVLLLVDHSQFKKLDPMWMVDQTRARTVIDTRGVLDRSAWNGAGFRLFTLGVGESNA
jgi:UDP-N-acetyl-D-mannosaminuronate dehydrogenase